MKKPGFKFNPFSLLTALLCLLCISSTSVAFLAEAPMNQAALIIACFFWLCLPLAIYQELFYFRYRRLVKYFTDV